MNKHKIIITGILIIILTAFLASGLTYTLGHYLGKETKSIGFSLPDDFIPRWQEEAKYIKKYSENTGTQILTAIAEDDSDKQVEQIEELLKEGVDALLIVPVDSAALRDVVVKAYYQHVPVIAYDRLMVNMPIDYYVTVDMRDVGRLAAETLAKTSDHARIVYIGGSDTDNNAFLHKEGFGEALQQYTDKDFEIVGDWFTLDWRNDMAAEKMREFIATGQKFDAIVAGNDGLAGAAAEVARAAGVPLIFVSGGDGDPAACARIMAGEQTMTVYKPVQKLVEKAAQFAFDLLAGNNIATDRTTFNGLYDIPTYTVEPIVITKETIKNGLFNERCEMQTAQ